MFSISQPKPARQLDVNYHGILHFVMKSGKRCVTLRVSPTFDFFLDHLELLDLSMFDIRRLLHKIGIFPETKRIKRD